MLLVLWDVAVVVTCVIPSHKERRGEIAGSPRAISLLPGTTCQGLGLLPPFSEHPEYGKGLALGRGLQWPVDESISERVRRERVLRADLENQL